MQTSLLIPKVIGHRGAAAYAPENTLSSFHAAADIGTEWVHLNAKLTKDGEVVVFHDEELERCTGSTGLISETDFATLRELDAGSWFADSFLGEKIPTLEEALNLILDLGMGANIELSPSPGREVETAEAALDIATRLWPDDAMPPLVSSMSHVSLETAYDMIDAWPRGLILPENLPNWAEFVEHLGLTSLHIDAFRTTEEQIESYIEAQKAIIAHVVDQPDHGRELLRWGVDSFVSNRPDALREAVEIKH